MLLLLTMAFLARQAWGWVADRIGGLNTVLAGNLFQAIGMAAFLATQDEAGLFLVAGLFGLGFSGIVPAYVLTVRELFPAAEAAWRVPCLLFLSLSGMAAGGWLAGIAIRRLRQLCGRLAGRDRRQPGGARNPGRAGAAPRPTRRAGGRLNRWPARPSWRRRQLRPPGRLRLAAGSPGIGRCHAPPRRA